MADNASLDRWARKLGQYATDLDVEARASMRPGALEILHNIAVGIRAIGSEMRNERVFDLPKYACALCNADTRYVGECTTIGVSPDHPEHVSVEFLCLGGMHHRFVLAIPRKDNALLREAELARRAAEEAHVG